VTDFSLEGVSIQAAGNAQLELDDTSNTSSDSTALTAVLNPQDPIVQAKTLSTDGDANVDTITDVAAGTVNYLYGASGNDTLNGSADSDMLNGGPGLDHINGNAGNDLIVYDSVNNDVINGGLGIDTLRIDDGALALSLLGSGTQTAGAGDTMGPGQNVTVNLTGKAITNMEVILITEEAGTSSSANDPNDNVGTKVVLNAADVFNYSATHDLTVLGSPGDILELNAAGGWSAPSAPVTDSQNQTMITYTAVNGAVLHVDQQVTVSIV
jgi:Ca2+-binding RTX toxin-like protein